MNSSRRAGGLGDRKYRVTCRGHQEGSAVPESRYHLVSTLHESDEIITIRYLTQRTPTVLVLGFVSITF